jgi:catechol 2,3-dioxygenase-like lactoylglutathione lyase family enzyme/HEAT repeat protein
MTIRLDHIVIAVHDLDGAIADYRALGFTVLPGGTHANGATHNALIVFEDGIYLELLAATGRAPSSDGIDFSVLTLGDEGLVGYALGTDDLDGEAERLRGAGVQIGEIVSGARHHSDGTRIAWRLLLIEPNSATRGFAPFLIQDETPRAWRVPTDEAGTTHPNGAVGIQGIEAVEHGIIVHREMLDTKPIMRRPYDQYAVRLEREADDLDEFSETDPDDAPIPSPLPLRDLARTRGVRFFSVAGVAARTQAILTGLDTVDWNTIVHPYFGANVPTYLRMLSSEKRAVRLSGEISLYHNFIAPDAQYPATLPALLLQLLSIPSVPHKDELLMSLRVKSGEHFQEVLERVGESPHYPGYHRRMATQLRAVYTSGVPIYARLLDHAEPLVRSQAAEALGVCHDSGDGLTALLRRLEVETESSVRGAIINAVIQTWMQMGDPLTPDQLQQIGAWANDDPTSHGQFEAALGLARVGRGGEAVPIFARVLEGDPPLIQARIGGIGFVLDDSVQALLDGGTPNIALDWMQRAAAHPLVNVRWSIAYNVELISQKWSPAIAQSVAIMAQLLTDADENVRSRTLSYALGFISDMLDEVIRDLAAHDPSAEIRADAQQCIERIARLKAIESDADKLQMPRLSSLRRRSH